MTQAAEAAEQKNKLNLEVERQGYLKHIKNLRLAHKVQIKNEKFLTMTKIETIVAEKLAAYEQGVSKILGKFVSHYENLYHRIDLLHKDLKRYAKFIRKYELNMLETTIVHGGNDLQIPRYLYKKEQ